MTDLPKIAIVTGANTGIGLASGKALADKGFMIGACVRTTSPELDKLLRKNSGHRQFELDLSKDMEITACAKNIFGWTKTVDVLVNCAAQASGNLFSMTRVSDMRAEFDTNFFGPLLLSQYVAKKMIRAKCGSIVNIASTAALLADVGTLSYGGSKAAFCHATRVMAAELGPFGIRVNAIAPSVVETRMADLMDDAVRAKLDARSALKGTIDPEDVADLVTFLATDRSNKITGQILRIDRGMLL